MWPFIQESVVLVLFLMQSQSRNVCYMKKSEDDSNYVFKVCKSSRINTVKKHSVLESSWLPEPQPNSWLLESSGSSVVRTESNHSGNQGLSWQFHVFLKANREVREMLRFNLKWNPNKCNKCCNNLENDIYWPWVVVSFPLSSSGDGKFHRQ